MKVARNNNNIVIVTTFLLGILTILSSLTPSSAFTPSSIGVNRNLTRRVITSTHFQRTFQYSTTLAMGRKAGVASPEELKKFVEEAGERLMVIDVRNPDATVEPGDQKSLAVAPLPSSTTRPQAVHLIYNRETNSLPKMDDALDKDTPIITHCGGGGRGQLAKEYLEQNGFTNVLNGGGPKETDCWNEYGDK